MRENVITAEGLTKAFAGREVICDCGMEVQRGRIYGLLGKNGAGKTTLFKLLLGFLKPTAGKAAILGFDSVRDRIEVLRHTGSLIGTPVFYEHLSAADNLLLHLAYMGLEDADVDPALELVGLHDTGTQPVGEFSLGMRQRLAIARAIVHRPEVLILDEPANGLDPVGMRELRRLFRQLAEDGMTVLLSSHLLPEVVQTADRIGVMAGGKLALEADTEEILRGHRGDMEDYIIRVMEGGGGDGKAHIS